MGFLKKSSAPSELPNLAIDGIAADKPAAEPAKEAVAAEPVAEKKAEAAPAEPVAAAEPAKEAVAEPVADKPAEAPVAAEPVVEKEVEAPAAEAAAEPVVDKPAEAEAAPVAEPVVAEPVVAEPVAEKEAEAPVAEPVAESIKKVVDETLLENDDFPKTGFFDEILEDINGGLADTEKLEDWYEKKFVNEDVVGNMKGYWEGNKSDIIIKSFGAEYKRQINDKVKVLQKLEEDWREIYFRLVKKEEEMKKEERELKETVSEFVNLCKGRKHNGEEEKKQEE